MPPRNFSPQVSSSILRRRRRGQLEPARGGIYCLRLWPGGCGEGPLEGVIAEEGIRAPTPIALVAQQDLVRRRHAIAQDGSDGLEKDALILALSIDEGAARKPGLGDREGLPR